MSSPPKKKPSPAIKLESNSQEFTIDDLILEFSDEPLDYQFEEIKTPPKILNKNTVKILNKQAPGKSDEPILRPPILQKNQDGNIEIISEILQTDETEVINDPIKSARPVKTNVFPCDYCERSFPLRQLLDIHAANHVRDRKFACEVCKKGFFSKYDLGKHILIHTGERPFKCVICTKAFSRSTLLRRHERIHSDQPKFLCAYCERPFLSKDEWEKHTLNHQKRRPFFCRVCKKSFAFKQGLERHEVVHSIDQPFKCEHCENSFSTQGKLARHLTVHAGKRPYPCRMCEKSYLLSHHLTRHMRSHKEAGLASYKCYECDEIFTNRDDLIYHSAVHATESLTCPLCKDKFDSIDEVTEHIKLHIKGEQYACEFCDSIFLTEEKLQQHSNEHHVEEIEFYDNDFRNRKLKTENTKDDEVEYIISDSVEVADNGTDIKIIPIELEDGDEEYVFLNDEIIETEDVEEEVEPKTVESPNIKKEIVKSYASADKKEKPNASTVVKAKKVVPVVKVEKIEKLPVLKKDESESSTAKNKSTAKVNNLSQKRLSVTSSASSADTRRSPNTRSSATPATAQTASPRTSTVGQKQVAKPTTEKELPAKKVIPGRATKLTASTSSTTKTTVQPIKTAAINTSNAIVKKPYTNPITLTKPLPTITKKKSASASIDSKSSTVKKSIATTASLASDAKQISMKIGGKVVKVQQVRMSKADIESMKKQGKIEMKDGQLLLKQRK